MCMVWAGRGGVDADGGDDGSGMESVLYESLDGRLESWVEGEEEGQSRTADDMRCDENPDIGE
jgi:hypothetical protein